MAADALPFDNSQWENALLGAAYALKQATSLLCMCSLSDVHATVQIRDVLDGMPTLYLYDAYPGGVGISERVFRVAKDVFDMALQMVTDCPCG